MRLVRPVLVATLLAACSEAGAPPVPAVINLVSAGWGYTCALSDSARGYCWGGVGVAEGPDTLATATPMPVRGNFRWQVIGVGDGFACGLVSGADARCWALSAARLVPDGRIGDPAPEKVVDQPFLMSLHVGKYHVCGLDVGGHAYCWGENLRGQLGIGVFGGTLWNRRQSPTPVAGSVTFREMSLGEDWSCALATNGDVYCWGGGTGGPEAVPISVVSGQNFATLATGGPAGSRDHTCALTDAAVLYCWGTFHLTGPQPAVVTPPTGITFNSVRLGGTLYFQNPLPYQYQWHACARATDGQAFCWGDNLLGQLGDGTTTPHSAPAPAAPALLFQSITTGSLHTCGVTTVGEAYCWGSNVLGQLGTGSTGSMPVTAPARVNIVVR